MVPSVESRRPSQLHIPFLSCTGDSAVSTFAPATRSATRSGCVGNQRASRPRPPHGTARHSTRRRWRLSKLSLIPALVMLVGMSAICYPFAAQWFEQQRQSAVLAGYEVLVNDAEPEKEIQLANAEAYNAALTAGAVYEAGSNVPTSTGQVSESADSSVLPYAQQLTADGKGLMARLRIPRIDLDLPIYHGTSEDTLLEGLGHLHGTALPVGGAGMRPVITGHRGLAEAQMFTRLDELTEGDTFTIEVFGRVLTYRVFEKIVVEPDEQKAFLAEPGRDLATLVTCTPLGINTHRILVTGERIIPTPAGDVAQAGKAPEIPGFPWWAVLYVLGLALVGLYLWWAGLPPKRRKKKDDAASGQSIRERKFPWAARAVRVGEPYDRRGSRSR